MNWERISFTVFLLVWATAIDSLIKLWVLPQRRHSVAQRYNTLALLVTALFVTVMLPSGYTTIDRLAGTPNLAKLLADSLLVLNTWVIQPVVTASTASVKVEGLARIRREILSSPLPMISTITLLIILFALAPVHRIETPGYAAFMAQYGKTPFIAEYTFVSIGYLTVAIYDLFTVASRGSRTLSTSSLRQRVRLQAWGYAGGLALMAHECLYVTMQRLGLTYTNPGPVRNTLFAGSITLLMSGLLIDVYEWIAQYRAYRRLYPLWRALHQAIPQITRTAHFRPPQSALHDALMINNLGLRLYLRIVEIRDGMVRLQSYADTSTIEWAMKLCQQKGIDAKKARAIIEAARLRSAIRAKQLNRPGSLSAATSSLDSDDPSAPNNISQLTIQEVTYLQQVARAWRSPIVDAALVNGVPSTVKTR